MSATGPTLVILMTGATRGIGLSLAEAASVARHRVAFNHRSARSRGEVEAIADRLSALGGSSAASRRKRRLDAERLVAETVERFGRSGAVVNNAGIGDRTALADLDESAFTDVLHANLTSAFLISQARRRGFPPPRYTQRYLTGSPCKRRHCWLSTATTRSLVFARDQPVIARID